MLLLIEDDTTIARELQLRWQRHGWQPQCAGTLAEARRLLAQPGLVELVVLDLGLPDGDGLDLLAEIRRADPRLPVLVLTARDQVSDRVRGLRQGADDYLVKPFAIDELDARIEGLLRRVAGQRRQRASFNELHWLGDEGRALLGDVPLELSPREFEVLGLLASRAPRLLPKRVLVEALAESNQELNDSAAELYISRLRRKLAGSTVAIQTLRGFGYMLVTAGTGAAGADPAARDD